MFRELLDKRSYIAALFDIYSPLLTAKQQEAMRLCYEEDCSCAEIGEEFQSSRQAAGDLLKRTVAQLNQYEDKLGLYRTMLQRNEAIAGLRSLLEQEGLFEQAEPLLQEIGK